MLRVRTTIAALIVLTGCAGTPTVPPPPPETPPRTADELLALAPAGTRSAVVVSDRGLALAERAMAWMRASADAFPEVAGPVAAFQQQAAELLGLPEVSTLAALGLGDDRGFARFGLEGGELTIWPVADVARFRTAFSGTRDGVLDVIEVGGKPWRCRQARGAYVCATDLALVERLGTGSLAGLPALAGGRGDIEIVSTGRGTAQDGAASNESYTTVALEPGALVIRTWLRGPRMGTLAAVDGPPTRIAPGRASGFLALAPPRSISPVAARELLPARVLDAIDGPVTAVVPSGTAELDARISFGDAPLLRALLDRCDALPVPAALTLGFDGDGCALTTAIDPSITLAAWQDGASLRLARRRAGPADATGPALTALGRELAEHEWQVVAWGRGAGFAIPGAVAGWSVGGVDAASWSRSLAWIDELGVGFRVDGDVTRATVIVRSVLANPPEVADAMARLVPRALAGEDITDEVRALAAAHPTAPLADDVAAGYHGLLLPSAVGFLWASAILPSSLAADRRGPPVEPGTGDLDSKDVLARTAVAPSADVEHVLVSWKDASRRIDTRRTKAEAAALARELAERIRAAPDRIEGFMALYSDDVGSSMGRSYVVTPSAGFVEPFRDLALRLAIGEVGVVETPFGYHIMLRVAPPPPEPLESLAILARPPGTGDVEVRHILIGWKDTAGRAGVGPRAATRTRAQADDLARELFAKVKAGDDMAALMKAHSDDPASSRDGRSFTVQPGPAALARFAELALRLKPGEVGLVKTELGWHIVKNVTPPPDPLDSTALLARKPVTTRAKVKHILLGWKDLDAGDPRGQARTRAELDTLVTKTVAKLRRGAAIEPLMKELSEDPGSADSGRSYDVTPDAPLVKPFLNLSLRLKLHEVGVVKTQFGIHIIQRVE